MSAHSIHILFFFSNRIASVVLFDWFEKRMNKGKGSLIVIIILRKQKREIWFFYSIWLQRFFFCWAVMRLAKPIR
jgi:hypothetical protein